MATRCTLRSKQNLIVVGQEMRRHRGIRRTVDWARVVPGGIKGGEGVKGVKGVELLVHRWRPSPLTATLGKPGPSGRERGIYRGGGRLQDVSAEA